MGFNFSNFRPKAPNSLSITLRLPSPQFTVVLGVALIAIAVVYKRFLSASREGFPWYFTYLVLASIIPSAGFFYTVQRFVNWRAFSFTFLPDAFHQFTLGGDACRALRLVGLPADRDDGSQYRRLVKPADRGGLRLAGSEFHLDYQIYRSSY
jgi:hypothetical protein